MAKLYLGAEESVLSERFAEASAEYRRLAASLSALGLELTALGNALVDRDATSSHTGTPASQAPGDSYQPVLRAHLLGPFQLTFGPAKVSTELPGQAQTVLKYLLSHRKRPVSRESLLDLLWPDADPSTGQGRLRVVVHTLRKSLSSCDALNGKQLVMTQGSNIWLNPEVDLAVDVEEFEKLWHMGWKLRRDGNLAGAMRCYEQAESLYAGDYLEDEAYADWTLLKREALRDAYSTILTMLAGMSLESGDDVGAIIWSQKLLAQDDCREDAYRHLIVSHLRLGQSARAIHWYCLCERTLRRELGIEPGIETQSLVAGLGVGNR